VIVQAWEPAARTIQLASRLAVDEFLNGEIARRREYLMPPFGHLVRVLIDGLDGAHVVQIARDLADLIANGTLPVTVLGPAPLHRLRGRSRRAILVRGDGVADARMAAMTAMARIPAAARGTDIRMVIDVDPQTT
jgi:primosomal protein N' (replication factor Y) (superfamily II helicase)